MNRLLIIILIIFVQFDLFSQENIKEQPFYFIQLSDPQFGFISDNKDFEKEVELYSLAIKKINKLSPSFIIITGDFVNNSNDILQINEFKKLTKLFHSPVYLSPGNHDIGNDPTKEDLQYYYKNYGKESERFSFTYKNSTFIGFNSVIIKSEQSRSEEKKQFKWLKKELKKAKHSDFIFLFTHYPFFIKDFNEKVTYSNQNHEIRSKYFDLFEIYNVDAIFSGHLHNNAYSQYKNIQNIVTSSVGKQLGDNHPGIRIIKVYNDRFEHNYYPIENIPSHLD